MPQWSSLAGLRAPLKGKLQGGVNVPAAAAVVVWAGCLPVSGGGPGLTAWWASPSAKGSTVAIFAMCPLRAAGDEGFRLVVVVRRVVGIRPHTIVTTATS